MSLLPVEEALQRILTGVKPVSSELVALNEADGRVLAEPVVAKRTQPPFPASAMDGYAIRSSDVTEQGTLLTVVGEAAAGRGYHSPLGAGQAVRIFTGAPVPEGADCILIQENSDRQGDDIIAREITSPGRFVRPAGLDFKIGDRLLDMGRTLDPRALAVAAAANSPELTVRRRPVVAILATGDELLEPGEDPGPDQIIASNQIGLASEVKNLGATPLPLGIAPDDRAEIARRITFALDQKADVIVTLGGASVGEHDLVAASLGDAGMQLDFWRIAMRPGKPLMFGHIGPARVLGLPGNPVSSMVCSILFLRPLVKALLGRSDLNTNFESAVLTKPLPKNDQRQDYIRATVERASIGVLSATPFEKQDSSMLAVYAGSNALIVRRPYEDEAKTGDPCSVILLNA